MDDEDVLLTFVRGNENRARHLRRCFTTLRDHAPDPEVRKLAAAVLTGRADPRQAMRTRAMNEFVAPGLRRGLSALPLDDQDKLREIAERGRGQYLGDG